MVKALDKRSFSSSEGHPWVLGEDRGWGATSDKGGGIMEQEHRSPWWPPED